MLWDRFSNKFTKSCLNTLICQIQPYKIPSRLFLVPGRNFHYEQAFLTLSRTERPKQSVTIWTFLPLVLKKNEGCISLRNIDRVLFPSRGNSGISCFQISLDESCWFNHGMFLLAKIINFQEDSKLGMPVQSHHTHAVTHAWAYTLAFIQVSIY